MAVLDSVNARDANERQTLADSLNRCLVNLLAFYDMAKVAHWNVRGPAFGPLHALFGEVAAGVASHADALAERVAMLGGTAIGRTTDIAAAHELGDYPDITDGFDHVRALVERLKACVVILNAERAKADEVDAVDTFDALTVVIRSLEENHGWKLLAHVQ